LESQSFNHDLRSAPWISRSCLKATASTLSIVETNRPRKPVAQKSALSASGQTIWSTLSTYAREVSVHTLLQPGSRAPGLRILGLPSTPPGITRRRGWRSHRPVARTVRRCAPTNGDDRLRGDGRSSNCHGNEAGASRLCTGRVNFLKNCFPD
jgi:hypothetical protein